MSAPEPLVTIGIPTYNRAHGTLALALRSALHQTYPRIEVVVSDNCSTDDTPQLMAGIDDPRFRYVRHQQNLGANGNFNACLDAARGDYFLLLHDDDLIDPDFVETCVAAIPENRSVGVIRSGMRIIDAAGETVQTLENRSRATTVEEFVIDWLEGRTSVYFCNNLLNTEAVRSIGGFGTRHDLFQDAVAYVRVTAAHGCVNVPDVKASFRRHDSNMGGAALLRNWCEDSLEVLDTISEFAPDPAIRKRAKAFLCRVNYGYAASLDSPWQRLKGYRLVSRYFDASEPALRYAYRHDIRPRLRAFKRRLTGARQGTPDSRTS
ncbi:MAG: glycosyltransferase family 2 protein [Pseudomonadales bacterium]